MVKVSALPGDPDGRDGRRCLWLLWRLGGPTALQIGLVTAAMFAALLGGAGILRRKGAQTGYVATLLAVGISAAAIWTLDNIMTDRAATVEREQQVRCVERSDGQGRPCRRYPVLVATADCA